MDGERIQSVATAGSLMNRCREGNDVACVLAALVKNRWWFLDLMGFLLYFQIFLSFSWENISTRNEEHLIYLRKNRSKFKAKVVECQDL